MRSAVLLFLLAAPALPAQTQPPVAIERQEPAQLPNAPSSAQADAGKQLQADRDWEQLIRGTHYTRPEIRIQAVGAPIHCDVDKVTQDELFCTEHRSRGFVDLFIPREEYHVPRREIRDVRVYGRAMSTLLGAGIGIGLGAGLGSVNEATRTDGGEAYFALLFGGLGALIGHAIPIAGHPVYQHP